ncbi:shikimate kinase [Salinibacterium sp. PAMC 21357]|uniref:shikimate kinase n=1 Tax=Salinibacterium sp. PAMC 21357 TaxID=1112215 RepID=UPI000288C1BB|nr:shikimate kinase [Salinibacterium sp. PAMC 21357]
MLNDGGAIVVIIGAPGSGKTKVGKRLAKILDVPLIDTDKVVVASHGPIPELFTEFGEEYFREREREAVANALLEPAVVTLGGGAVLDLNTRADLASHRVVQLTMSKTAARLRIAGTKRPLAKNADEWAKLVEARQPIYDELSLLTIDTSLKPMEKVAREIADWLGTQQQ